MYTRDTIISIQPFTRQSEGEDVIIGRVETGVFLAVPAEAVEVLDDLALGKTVGEVEDLYRQRHGETPDLEEFLSVLESKGIVRPVIQGDDGGPAPPTTPDQGPRVRYHFSNFPHRLAQRLFSPPVLAGCFALIVLALAAAIQDPSLAPGGRDLYFPDRRALTWTILVAVGYLTIFVHELGHLIAARALGINSRMGISHRLWYLVAETRSALKSFQSLPGVESCGIVYAVPMGGATESSVIRIPDKPPQDDPDKRPFANYTIASTGYFSAVRTPLLRGRDFLESDTSDSIPVVVINNTMANKFWPGEEPIGKQVGLGSTRFPLMNIIGVVADVKRLSLRESPGPEMYVPYTQKVYPSMRVMQVVLRGTADAASVTGSVREAVDKLDPDLPMAKVTTLTNLVDNSLAQPRFSMLLLSAFGAIALLLACLGVYGVISYSVAQRTQEIGIRLAVGARPRQVLAMVLGQGARLAGLGIATGLLAALAVTRIMASFLYGVRATDPITFAGVTLLLIVVALLACYLPARRATRVDPLIAIRYE